MLDDSAKYQVSSIKFINEVSSLVSTRIPDSGTIVFVSVNSDDSNQIVYKISGILLVHLIVLLNWLWWRK
jgi:hypothetical protein